MWDTVFSNFGLRMTTNYIEEEKFIRNEDKKEIEDYQRASEELGVSGVDLGYLPKGMEYLNCEIDSMSGCAIMFYSYQDTIFRLSMIKKNEESVDYYAVDNETKFSDIFTDAQKIKAKIGPANGENRKEAYVAQIQYEDCKYILNGMISLKEMQNIIKNIYFL